MVSLPMVTAPKVARSLEKVQSVSEAIAQQPVSIAMETDQTTLQLYKTDVATSTGGTNLVDDAQEVPVIDDTGAVTFTAREADTCKVPGVRLHGRRPSR